MTNSICVFHLLTQHSDPATGPLLEPPPSSSWFVLPLQRLSLTQYQRASKNKTNQLFPVWRLLMAFSFYFYLCYELVSVWVYATCAWVPTEARRGTGSHGAGVIDDCKLTNMELRTKLRSYGRASVITLWTIFPPLLFHTFNKICSCLALTLTCTLTQV